MAAQLHMTPSRATDANGNPYGGAKWYFYATTTTTPQNVYSNATLGTSLGAVVTADSAGWFPSIYLDASLTYRGILKDSTGAVTLADIDPLNPALDAAGISYTPAGTGGIATDIATTLGRIFHQDDYTTYANAVAAAGDNPLFADPQTNSGVVGAKVGKHLVVSGMVIGDDTDYGRDPDGFVSIYIDRLFGGAPWQEMRGLSSAIRMFRTSADEGTLGWDVIPVLGATVITAENTQYIRGNMKAVVGELIFQKPTAGTYTVLTAHNHQATTFVEENVTVTNWYGYVVGQPGHAGTNPGTITNAYGLFVDNMAGGGLTLTNAAAVKIGGTGNAGRIWWAGTAYITMDSGSKLEMSLNGAQLVLTNALTATTVGAAGGASALPATPTGYWRIIIGGTPFKIPYYAD